MTVKRRHPMQEIVKDDYGKIRFQANEIVRYLLDHGTISLNDLCVLNFAQDDWEQFYQLIGYDLVGYHELDEVSDHTAKRATMAARLEGFEDAKGCRDVGCLIHSGIDLEDLEDEQ